MVAPPTPLVRLRRLAPSTALWAKLEGFTTCGSVYARVADAIVAEGAAGRPLCLAGDAAWCLALLEAAARAGRRVVGVVACDTANHEARVLLRDAVSVVAASAGALSFAPADRVAAAAEQRAAGFGAIVPPVDASALFGRTLGAELSDDLAALAPLGAPATWVLYAPDDAHGLIEGLRAAGHRVQPVRAEPGATTLEGLRTAVTGDGALAVGDALAQATRARAATAEGLLVGHGAAAVFGAALAAPPSDIGVIVVVTEAGDRSFSQDVVAEPPRVVR